MVRLYFWRLLRSNTLIITSTISSFFLGLLFTTVLGQVLASQSASFDTVFQVVIIIVLIVFLTVVSFQFKQVQDLIRRQRLTAEVNYSSLTNQDRRLYEPINEAIASARKSVRVVSMYRSLGLPYKTGREGYYKIISDAIRLKIELNQPFVYERILQVESVRPGRLSSTQTDPVTFQHCVQLLEWRKQKSTVTINVKQIPNILGGLSFLLIDDERFVFVIPDIIRDAKSELQLEGLLLGMIFEDPDGILTEPMRSFFAKVFNEADTILTIDTVSSGPNTTLADVR